MVLLSKGVEGVALTDFTEKQMLHGTDYPIEEFILEEGNPSCRGAFDICLTDDSSIAEMYATRWSGEGTVVEFSVQSDLRIATQEEALAILGSDAETTSDVFHAIDEGRAELVAAGFDGVTYMDQLPGTVDVFETTRIYRADALTICGSWTC